MKKLLAVSMAALLALSVTACDTGAGGTGGEETVSTEGAVELDFMFWGGLEEKAAVDEVVANYNKLNEGKIHVTSLHVPDDYPNKLATMVAGGTAPDVAYLSAGLASTYALEGNILFVEDILNDLGEDTAFLDTVLDDAKWNVGGKVACFSTAMEALMIAYNKDIFDEHGVEYPPSKFEEALTWEEFVELCQKVTVDSNGNNALSPDFDPKSIVTYGLSMDTYLNHIILLAVSNGASFLNADSTDTDFASDEWIDTMNKINDLIYKYHVVPSPAAANALTDEAMLSGQVAMSLTGNWSLLAYYDQGLNTGLGVMPDLGNGPWSMSAPGVTAIFSQTEHPAEAWDFYKFSLDAEQGPSDLYINGLWQPVYKEYYTDPEKIAFWVDNDAHPEEYRDVVIANYDRNIEQLPSKYILQLASITDILTPAIEAVFGAEGDARPIMEEAQATITSTGAYKGRFDQ